MVGAAPRGDWKRITFGVLQNIPGGSLNFPTTRLKLLSSPPSLVANRQNLFASSQNFPAGRHLFFATRRNTFTHRETRFGAAQNKISLTEKFPVLS
jgi:hypothetical protein